MNELPLLNGNSRLARSRSTVRAIALLLVGFAGVLVALFADLDPMPARFALSACLAIVVVASAQAVRGFAQGWLASLRNDIILQVVDRDVTPCFLTDEDGQIVRVNPSAERQYGSHPSETLANALRFTIANPSAVLFRLQARARRSKTAEEEIVTRTGHIKISAQSSENNLFLWRIERLSADRGTRSTDQNAVPLVTVSHSGTVLFMNDAAKRLVGSRAKTVTALFGTADVTQQGLIGLRTDHGVLDVLAHPIERTAMRRDIVFLPLPQDAENHGMRPDDLPVPMLRVNATGHITRANALACEMLGACYKPNVSMSQVMEGLGRPINAWLEETLKSPGQQRTEFLRLRRQDREMFVQVTLSRADTEEAPELVAVLNDATELKTLEAQFVQSQKMQAIGQLAGGVAHDFNNLLTAISGHCDLLLLRHDQGDPDFGDLIQINENANRAAALVGQLLAFSRKQTLQPEQLDLRDTLADLTHLLNRLVGEKITLTLSHDPVLKPIRADKRQIEQVLMNLVVNARDAMANGGEINVRTEVTRLDTALVRDRATVPLGEYVTVKVSDQGTGIDADKTSKIFEPFYTTKRTGEGTGLGLSTAYGIIKQSGGFIFVDSVKGSGTEFTLYFPVQEEAQSNPVQAEKRSTHPLPNQAGGNILLVEDEAPVRAFASRALRLRGYTVIEADCGEGALQALDKPDVAIDVIVTDVVMPGMDGPTWVRKALKTRPDLRVVFVSGYAERAFGGPPPDLPNSVFLAKPFSLAQLTDTVGAQFGVAG